MPDWLPQALALAALACVVAAAICDVRAFEIPDELSIALVVLALAYGLLTPGFAWLSHLVAPVAVFAAGLLLFARGMMGGGDIKLLTALAAWTGLQGLLPLLLGISLSGGVLAIVLLVARHALDGRPAPRVFSKDAPLPYAVAILGGTLWWARVAWPLA
jgi:prepilin peptidase CpaA